MECYVFFEYGENKSYLVKGTVFYFVQKISLLLAYRVFNRLNVIVVHCVVILSQVIGNHTKRSIWMEVILFSIN